MDITVAIIAYNPNLNKLYRTLDSIFMQEKCEIKLIISDDGSEKDYFDELLLYIRENGINDPVLIRSKVNQGTVRNCISALEAASTEYIKFISPGDYLYDKYTLFSLLKVAKEKDADILYGKAVYYKGDRDKTAVKARKLPYDETCFNNQRKLIRAYLLHGDYAHGVASIVRSECFLNTLRMIEKHVVYAEDMAFRLMIMSNVRTTYVDKNIILYESGTGISTGKSIKWRKLIDKDEAEYYSILIQMLQKNNYKRRIINKVNRIKHVYQTKNHLTRLIVMMSVPERFVFKIKRYIIPKYFDLILPSAEMNPAFYKTI